MHYLLTIILATSIYLPMICTNPIRADGVLHLNCAPGQAAVVAWVMPAPGYIGSTSFYVHILSNRTHVRPKALNTPVKGFLFGHYDPIAGWVLERIGWSSTLESVYVYAYNCLPGTRASGYNAAMNTLTPKQIAALQEAGYGEYIAQDADDIATETFFFLSADDLERMTPEERERFGVVEMYEAMRDLP